MTTFAASHTYTTRSVCDSDCVISAKIIKRTACTVRASINGEPAKTFRIAKAHDGGEMIRPWGNYSMCPLIRA